MHYDCLYSRLDLSPLASLQDVKQQYRKLALIHHPDKKPTVPSSHPENSITSHTTFVKISQAYTILSDPEQKAIYDARLQAQSAIEPHLTIDLEDMLPQLDNVNNEPTSWTYACRCGSNFVITVEDMEQDIEIVQCSGCSIPCRIVYFAIEDPQQ